MINKRVSWWKGKKLSEKYKERISQGMTGKKNMLGHTHKKETKDKIRSSLLGHKHSPETIEKIKMAARKPAEIKRKKFDILGRVTPITKLIRHSRKYAEWRMSVFIRDDFTCQECGERGVYLEAHHHIKRKTFSELIKIAKNTFPLFPLYDAALLYTPLWDISIGITLCNRCHNKHKKKG